MSIIQDIGIWIWLIAGLLLDVVLVSYILFGGRIRWSIELYGPLRFISKREDGDINAELLAGSVGQRLNEIKRRQAEWDEEPFGCYPDENSPSFIAERLEGAWLQEQVPFLLKCIDQLRTTYSEAISVIDKVHKTATLNDSKFARFVERELGYFLSKHNGQQNNTD